jgi:hypothetical protein
MPRFPVLLLLTLFSLPAQDPQFTASGELRRPQNYREWIYLTTGLGMNYGSDTESAQPRFDNVFVTPESYRAFVNTGHWPEKTMFILEVRSAESHGSINRAGHFQSGVVAVEAAVKDTARYPGKWAYFSFGEGDSLVEKTNPFPQKSVCNQCHVKNTAVENTFVQFYPTLLEIAKAKGTLNPHYAQSAPSGK